MDARRGPKGKTVNSKGLDLDKLCESIKRDRMVLQTFRENRVTMTREYVGRWWGENGTKHEVPINLLSLYIQITTRNLIAKDPRVMYATFNRQGKAPVSAMETWANKEIKKQCSAETYRDIIVDGFFGLGIAKISLVNPAESAAFGYGLSAGQAALQRVDLDDWFYQTTSTSLIHAGYSGHRYRVPLAAVRESRAFNSKRKDIEASDPQPYNEQGDERIRMLGQTYYAVNGQEFQPYCDLWEVYIPDRKLVLTFGDDNLSGPRKDLLIAEQEWLGHDKGPYRYLGFQPVSGNAMPKAPLQDLFDLHLAINNAYRKLLRQAHDMKQYTAYQRGQDKDAQRVSEVNDGGMVGLDAPEKMVQMKGHAPNQELSLFSSQMELAFNKLAGNLETMGGLSPQAGTATQEKILNQNSGGTMADKQGTVVKFVDECEEARGWYWWHDPFKVIKVEENLPGLPEISQVREVTPQQRQQVPWEELDLRVDQYSMAPDTPAQRAKILQEVVQTTIMPAMALMQQQGIGFDMNVYLDKIGKYYNIVDLPEILSTIQPPQQDTTGGLSGSEPGMPAVTERTNIRESTSTRSPDSANKQISAALAGTDLGGNPNGRTE